MYQETICKAFSLSKESPRITNAFFFFLEIVLLVGGRREVTVPNFLCLYTYPLNSTLINFYISFIWLEVEYGTLVDCDVTKSFETND